MTSEETPLTELAANRPTVLKNVTCPYCGCPLHEGNAIDEHVVGRRFVPKRSLHGNWNLILRACTTCNTIKSALEDDISAITLANRCWHGAPDGDEALLTEARRKATGSFSKKTKKPVIDSREEMCIQVPIGSGATASFNLTCPPQLAADRVFQLAGAQLTAFFYFMSYNEATRRGGFWPGGFHPIMQSQRNDWGNSIQVSFMNAVIGWVPRLHLITAEGFYWAAIRRHPAKQCWSWALEWNRSHRVIGFFGVEGAMKEVVGGFGKLQVRRVETGDTSFIRIRQEVPLAEDKDRLFAWSGESLDPEA